jgi:hypothetical protein
MSGLITELSKGCRLQCVLKGHPLFSAVVNQNWKTGIEKIVDPQL